MSNATPIMFDEKLAASYDRQAALWAPAREALFLFARLILADLPTDARILCVGVGTGTELLALAEVFPEAHFAAVEPAAAMLDVCRQKVEAQGLTSRCTFHQGYVDSLPECEPFDAATSLLVSQFVKDTEERTAFFGQIATRLRPGGVLINTDLVLGLDTEVHERLLEVWLRMLGGSDWSEADIEKMRAAWRTHLAALTPIEIESIIAAGGFERPVLFFQTLFIHGWFARRIS